MNTLFVNFSIFFVLCTLLLSLCSNNILMFWVLLEISSFFLIFLFLNDFNNGNVNFSSFLFYLFSGISSIFLVSGSYYMSSFLLLSGLCIKFFLFPFLIILYYIFNNISWILIFIIGSLFKGFILCLTYFFYLNNNILEDCNNLLCIFTWCILLYYLLSVSLTLKGLWFVLNLGSSTVLYLSCYYLSNNLIFFLFLIYLILSIFNIYLLSSLSISFSNNINSLHFSSSILYLLTFVGFPVSINIVYKIISIVFLFYYSSFILLLVWCLYIIFETIYLFFYFSSLLEKISVYY
nr:NADH dehydrogenase subunit 2 [Gyrodactylus sp. FZ-2021]